MTPIEQAELATRAEALDPWTEVEDLLGSNLHWLTDQFDLRIRQGDEDVIRRLRQIDEAWRIAARNKPKT